MTLQSGENRFTPEFLASFNKALDDIERYLYKPLIKTHGSEARGQETTKRTPTRGLYYELFTCRVGFTIYPWITQWICIALCNKKIFSRHFLATLLT